MIAGLNYSEGATLVGIVSAVLLVATVLWCIVAAHR